MHKFPLGFPLVVYILVCIYTFPTVLCICPFWKMNLLFISVTFLICCCSFFDCQWNYKLLQPLQNLKLSASCVLCFLL